MVKLPFTTLPTVSVKSLCANKPGHGGSPGPLAKRNVLGAMKLVTFSIDPDDDPPRLQAFATELGADPAVWHLASGGAPQLKSVIGGGFSVYYKEQEDGRFKLDPAFILVDGNGVMRAEYRTDSPDIDIILRDMGLLAAEVDNSDGIYRFAYEAAHLFSCYPR